MRLPPFLRHKVLDAALWALLVVCVVVMLKASADPSPVWARGTWLQTAFSPFSTGNQVAFDVSVGVIVSLFVYVLVVRLPEKQKRNRLKVNLRRQYSVLKDECITNFLFASHGSADLDLVEQLKDLEAFKRHFKEQVSPGGERWGAVLNGLDELRVTALSHALANFRRELEYALTAIDIDDPQLFAFLRQLTRVLYRNEQRSTDYDEIKSLSQFMWSMHTGWDWVDGYTGRDSIADMIEAI